MRWADRRSRRRAEAAVRRAGAGAIRRPWRRPGGTARTWPAEGDPRRRHDDADVVGAGGHRQDGVELGHDDAELAERTVAAVRRCGGTARTGSRSPAASRSRSWSGIPGRWDLLARRLLDPFLRDQLLAVPFALLQVELAELGEVFGAEVEAAAAERVALGAAVPAGVLDAQRLEQSRLEVFQHGLAGHLRDDGREHVAAERVVLEVGAGLVRDGVGEELLDGGPAGTLFGSTSWPQVMVSRSRTFIALRLSEGSAGASSGKNFSTGSSRLSFPSAIARPTAVALKLLLSECSTCGLSAASGFHQPSAMTWPWRRTIMECRPRRRRSISSANADGGRGDALGFGG